MIVVYPFYPGDQHLAEKNAQWMNELGGCKGHEVLMIWDKRCTQNVVDSIGIELSRAFDKVHTLSTDAAIDGWPEGANLFFRMAACKLQSSQWRYFMWMEPDAIPMKPGWLDTLEAEFLSGGKPFMGDRVQVGDIPLHMSGVGFYPNPLHAYSGEAYRAAEIAFDMAGREQIVHQAHFTKLIEHAWKHPKFTSIDELRTQIRPECILFHSSKDGSLIDLLRGNSTQSDQQIAGKSAVQVGGPAPNGLSGREVGATSLPPQPQSEVHAGSSPVQAITCDIFIRTYPGDYQWLEYCLESIQKFCTGFQRIWVISPAEFKTDYNRELFRNVIYRVMNDETEDGYLAQQITKLYADVITDYQADHILHVDSDVIFTRPCTPQDFFANGKLIWYYTPFSAISTPWQAIMEKFMTFTQPYEFMRRFPMMMPRWIYPKLREFCHRVHGMVISDYIKMQPPRAFSEFNALGCFAYFNHPDQFLWVDTLAGTMPEPYAKQYHSWSGISPEIKTEIETNLRGAEEFQALGQQPPAAHTLGAATSVPSQIKVLPNDIWVLKDDQISQWVEQEGRLDHDQNLLPDILKHIRPGDCVVDVGAFIGDHTLAYSHAVDLHGTVYAFEPNPEAFQCLKHNLSEYHNAHLCNTGLSDKEETVPLSGNNGNHGGAYIGEHMKLADIKLERMDDMMLQPNFIKIDVEGYEPKVLDGMQQTLELYHPVMVIEVNQEALRRQGFKPNDIFRRVQRLGYEYSVIQENCNFMSPMYDILCSPKPQEPAPLTPWGEVCLRVDWLREFAEQSLSNKKLVMQALVYGKLKEPRYKPRKKKNETVKKPVHPTTKDLQPGGNGAGADLKCGGASGGKKLVQAKGKKQA